MARFRGHTSDSWSGRSCTYLKNEEKKESAKPGPINNEELLEDPEEGEEPSTDALRGDLTENVDFDFVSAPVWETLLQWYLSH